MTTKKSWMMLPIGLLFSLSSNAMMWGTGMWGGNQACGYELKESEEATSLKEEREERSNELREAKSELRRLKSRTSALKSSLNARRDLVKLTGFDGEALSMLDNHITIGRKCEDYHRIDCPPLTMVYRPSRMPACGPCGTPGCPPCPEGSRNNESVSPITPIEIPPVQDSAQSRAPEVSLSPVTNRPSAGRAVDQGQNSEVAPTPNYTPGSSSSLPIAVSGIPVAETCGAGNLISSHPFRGSEWRQHCGPGAGEVRDSICSVNVPNNRPKTFNAETCRRHMKDWVERQKELRDNELKIAEIELKVRELEAVLRVNRIELREAQREWQREIRESQSEGDCVDCVVSRGSVFTPRRASGWEIAANVALGIGSMYLGNQLNKHAMDSNAKLGFPTQPYPAFGYGFPYFMGALYGAVGGSMGGGAFGCFGGNMGPYGGIGPFGMGGVYGPRGGVFGYPPGMWGSPMSGGVFLPGMGGFGMPGPWGGAMCVTWPCPVGGGMGMMMPGMGMMAGGGLMMPGMMVNGGIGMMVTGMMMPGMMAGGGIGMMSPGMMMPGMMAGGGIGMMSPGMMMPGMMAPGMMAGGGIGMMSPGMMGPGMGMMMGDMGSMQMQQQMMQMQMQAYQQAMQMQQQRMQQQMAQQQVISGLTQELYTLMFRLQQAQMGMFSVRSSPISSPTFPGNPGWGSTPQPFPGPGVPSQPGIPGGSNPGNSGPPRFR